MGITGKIPTNIFTVVIFGMMSVEIFLTDFQHIVNGILEFLFFND